MFTLYYHYINIFCFFTKSLHNKKVSSDQIPAKFIENLNILSPALKTDQRMKLVENLSKVPRRAS